MKNILPVLLLKNLILLPNQEVKLELNNLLSQEVVLLSSNKYNNELIVLPIKDQKEEMPDVSDLPKIAIVAKVKSKIELPNGNTRVTLRGLFRAGVKNLANDEDESDLLKCQYEKIRLPFLEKVEAMALIRKIEELLKKYISYEGVSNSILNVLKDVKDLNKYTDVTASFLPISFLRKLEYIEEINAINRANLLIEDLCFELEVLKLDKKLENKLQNNLEVSQKEYILKEKLKEIEEELGITKEKNELVDFYYQKLKNISFDDEKTKEKIRLEIKKLEYMSDASLEQSSIRNYLDWVFSLPWNDFSIDTTDLESIKNYLDTTHYKMIDAKERILEYVAAKKRNDSISVPILCLVGPSGVGKTTLASSIAKSLNKSFYKISVGGLNDSSLLNGHKRTYLSSAPGKIIEALRKCGVKNPVILIDEIDKMVHDYKGDPSSTLLDILDQNQNKHFVDNYIEEEFDLSHILFITTANSVLDIPKALLDRLEVIELNSYTTLEKLAIAKKYLLPKIYKNHCLNSKNIKFSDNSLKEIILYYTLESGVRDLERVLVSIIRKLIVKNELDNVKITNEEITKLLGSPKYLKLKFDEQNLIGFVNALAINSNKGMIIPVEVCKYKGSGKINITGSLEKVMEESISVSISYIKSKHELFNIDINEFQEFDYHLHFLSPSIKKDGPSAGVTITTAILSLLKQKIIPKTVAMSGEITLNGYIHQIGGLKEKLIGAYNEGIKKIFIPLENHQDLIQVPIEILEKLEIIEVENYEEIYKNLF